ncbi:AAA family ATPase [Thermaerobacter subterraneus]|uniref:AAA family ATPase n=1 Tax=Thermaerobacter subterraneus TaxID=175696 RepID=UPI0001EB4D5F|nr:AAA family ATPase [Thermaerobacter subterraneus]
MTRYYLAGLTVEGFRGINNNGSPLKMKFDPNKITSIFGGNGLGKSSLFDAITYAITGNVPRLAKIQNTENASRYYLNRFHTGPAAITLTFIPDDSTGEEVTITIKRDAQGRRIVEASGSLDPDQLLTSINCETLLLDYTTFNDFITSSPLDRGRTFARLLGLGSLSVIRKNLEALSNTRNLNSDCQLETLQRRLGEVQRKRDEAANKVLELLTSMEKTGLPPDSFDPCLAERLCLEALSEISGLRSLVEGRRLSDIDFDKCEEQLSRVEGANETKALKQLVTTREDLETAVPIDKLKRKCDALLSLAQTHMSLTTAVHNERPYKDLYESAFKIVEMGLADEKCPLCEQASQHPSGLDLRSFLIQVLGEISRNNPY